MSILDEVRRPATWRATPFGRVARRVQESGRPDLPSLSVFLGAGVVPRSSREDNHNRLGEDLTKYLVVRPGDIVFNKLRTWQGGLGASQHEGIVSPAYFVCRPGQEFDSRFLHYLLLSATYLQELTRLSKWQPPSQFDIGWDQLKSLPIVSPVVEAQRAIADFLDRETARIDALITAKRRMIEVVAERAWVVIVDAIEAQSARFLPLRRALTRIADGPFGSSLTSAHYAESGARVVRLGNIGFAAFRDDDQAFIPLDHYESLLRHRVREGDLIIAGLGDANHHVGRACVAPDLGPAIVKADCFCATVNATRYTPEFLALYLSSPLGRSEIAVATRGSTRSRINLDIARDIPIPAISLGQQAHVVAIARQEWFRTRGLSERLTAQIELLVEHRQALITAAVTGELNVGVAA